MASVGGDLVFLGHVIIHCQVSCNLNISTLLAVSNLNKKKTKQPWLVWLGGLSTSLRTKRSPARFPVRAHAWVAGQVPTWERTRGN